ncbi:LLM class flavin-dependent oxidoreductase [Paenibacillus sp. OAS669]|uniref:LLM class flavin-dependent oxidoreductase n=1 Tax=Paenibacillus sp. OAS669 TaxID=2663821 RepID=UPI001788EF61|nr:LLM class flavin-dependent oxidoreductase [Paenibacillus sp. OAS669]MBE1445344.1 luciferase family oxidoreductase group 1 [Paenibacillus sp. OAS669]
MGLKLSILDQSPIDEGETAEEAFRHTVELARKAEELGYYRFWVSEHHDSEKLMGSSPEVLISYLLAHTKRIRIGSGGVMLQHYSPYKVAENFNVLASLAPGRIDLGIGRAPGGLPRSTKALQQESYRGAKPLEEKLVELEQYLNGTLPESHPLYGVKAVPAPQTPPELFLLGTSASSAALAAQTGIPYVFAKFINGDEAVIEQALHTYRTKFVSTLGSKPQAILGVSVIVTDTDEEAKALAVDSKHVKIQLESGKTINVKSLEAAEEYGRQSDEKFTVEVKDAPILHGSKHTVREQLLELQRRYDVEELILIVVMKSFAERLHAYELLQEAFSELTV